uniref:tyrosine-type recombinase/integrase n=1 Tax=Vibrio taketomensis TaxID=2572923 RepID=UPI002F96D4C3
MKNAKPKDKEYNLSDGYGLQCRIKPTGTKVWLFNYKRPSTHKRTNLSIGRYPIVALKDARNKRDEYLSLLAKGIDPLDHINQEANKQSLLLENVIAQWFEIKKHNVSNEHGIDILRSLELHVLPKIGNTPIDQITPMIVINSLRPLAEKGSLETVKRVCQRLNEVMTFAVNVGLIEFNLLAGVRHAFRSPKATHMPTLKPEQLGQLMVDLMNANIRRITRLLIEWQLHTMVRPSEAAGAKWNEINWEEMLWIVPPNRMKKGLEHIVPLTPQALRILNEAKKCSDGSPYIFPADRKRNEPVNPQTANMALKRMGYEGKLVAHGLRALASTTLNEEGWHPDIIEAALAHVDKNSVRRAYNRAKYIERRTEMMCWWSKHIDQSLSRCLTNN